MTTLKTYLEKLVAWDTVTSEPAKMSSSLNWIELQLKLTGMKVERFESNGYPSIVSATFDTKCPKVLLQAHLDVVPGDSKQFTLVENDGRYYGRGVFDMKFAIACYLRLSHKYKSRGDLDFGLMITTDEEIGGYNGVKLLMNKGYRAGVCILPDGGDNWQIDTSSRGVWHLRLEAKGDGAHGSRPWEGDNALTRLLEAARILENAFPSQPDDPISVALTTFHAGEATNQIPDQASCTLDIRFRTKADYQKIERKVESVCKEFDIRSVTLIRDPAFGIPPTNGYIKAFSRMVQKRASYIPVTRESYGSSDARFMAEKGIPVIISRPIGGDPHGEDEWIDIASMQQFYAVLEDFVLKFARIG